MKATVFSYDDALLVFLSFPEVSQTVVMRAYQAYLDAIVTASKEEKESFFTYLVETRARVMLQALAEAGIHIV